jgi:hypothetical protein
MKRLLVLALFAIGCSSGETKVSSTSYKEDFPVFSLSTSEYPSWSTFMVAEKAGLINPLDKEPGTLEKKWKVRIKLEVKDYDTCLSLYGSNSVDAVCMTNIDALNPALGRPSTAIMPTSTSVGADKVIVNAPDLQGSPTKDDVDRILKANKTYGLEKSVSQFVYYRGLQKLGLDPKSYVYENLDPAAAATALQTNADDKKSICVWNPFALETLRKNKDSKTLFDSSSIPEEVIDMVVVANDSLNKEGGANFAKCVCDTFYEVCRMLENEKTSEQTLKALGEDFSNLPPADMKICTKETRFYSTPESGVSLFTSIQFSSNMDRVVDACKALEILGNKAPTLGYGKSDAQLTFDIRYMDAVDD